MTTTIVFDIETDGLKNPSKIYCISTMSLEIVAVVETFWDTRGVKIPLTNWTGTIEEALEDLKKADVIIGHNIIGYDLPVIKKLYPSFKLKPTCKIIDTMLMACIFDADGAISLEDWSIKLGKTSKVANEDWSVLTENMLIRNRSDVLITKEVYDFILTNYGEPFPWSSLELEQKVAAIHQKQVEYGVWFDEEAAISLYNDLCLKMIELEKDILKDAPKRCVRYKKKADEDGLVYDMVKPFLKSGDHTTQVTNWFDKDQLPHVRGPCCRIEFKEIELGSSDQVKALLLSLGWKPTTYNFSKKTGLITSPQLTEDSYDSIPPGLGQKIAEYNTIKHRRNYLFNQEDDTKGALNNIRPDGRIPAEGMTCATNTARYRHSGVVCNVPRVKSKYGKEIRALFGVEKGKTMLGFDLAGIEARMLAHFCYKYPGGKEMADLILHGDFHQYNADAWDVSRDIAKNGLYALVN